MTTDPLASVGLVLLALFVALSWLTRRVAGGSLRSHDRKRVTLTSQHTVHVVEAGGVRLLVGTAPGSAPRVLARLGEVDAPAPAPTVAAPRPWWARAAAARSWDGLLGRVGAVGGR